MSHVRHRFALPLALIALPLGLAWYGATQRSWLPRIRQVYKLPQGGHIASVQSVHFALDGATLSTSGFDVNGYPPRQWRRDTFDAGSLEPLRQLKPPSASGFLTFAPDGKTFVRFAAEPKFMGWDGETGHSENQLELRDSATGTLLWSHRERDTLPSVPFATFSPRGNWLATRADGKVLLKSLSGTQTRSLGGDPTARCVAFTPDERFLVSGGEAGYLCVWDVTTGKLLHRLMEPIISGNVAEVLRGIGHPIIGNVAVSPNSALVACMDYSPCVFIWDRESGRLRATLQNGDERVWSLAFAPQGSLLATGTQNGTIVLWDALSGNKLRTLALQPSSSDLSVDTLAWSPDGSVLVGGYTNGTIARWRIR